jgi:hypothetical protein
LSTGRKAVHGGWRNIFAAAVGGSFWVLASGNVRMFLQNEEIYWKGNGGAINK